MSDHNMLLTKLECPQLCTKRPSSPIKKMYFDLENMTQENWLKFASRTDALLDNSPIKKIDSTYLSCYICSKVDNTQQIFKYAQQRPST